MTSPKEVLTPLAPASEPSSKPVVMPKLTGVGVVGV
jgi:hypothetical protein